MLSSILSAYGLQADQCEIHAFGTGLINNTWKITHGNSEYILQRINQNVFRQPPAIARNIRAMADYLGVHSPGYLFVVPLTTIQKTDMVHNDEGYFRLMPFIKRSRTFDVATTPEIACEAAREFGCFTKNLSGFDASKLEATIPDFHNLTLRYRQFETSLDKGNKTRIGEAKDAVSFLLGRKDIVTEFEKIRNDDNFKIRVTHHDTKISNVLFDDNGNGICVIDLDTTMPGYFISDVGDMMRTYLSPLSEEEKDFSGIEVRDEYFLAIAKGYLQEMSEELTESELDHFVYSGEFMIYMQAVRFLTDYFNDDVYYGSKYEGHNFVRAQNQITLLKRYQEKAPLFREQVMQLAGSQVKK
ncbi:MAG: aminoglycoside phosphotransferase family protein [Chitinophagaceae bacterium]|nr:aminoglycoside phosphotransferase family protein [Chitinophagaceae bacterium]